mmetsp:Transcript_146/g.352  ORF Transcript_146/g.352 Transcript_146/m.352 type:complete len:303 (+) Transcript_146:2633-3541(+)
MHVRPHKVVELVHDPVNDLDEQVALLVLQRRLHQQRQHLVEKRPRAQVARLVGKLPQRRLALRRRAVLDLEQQLHDLALLGLLHTQLRLVHVLEQLTEVLHVLRLHLRQALGRERHVLSEAGIVHRHLIKRREVWCRCCHELFSGVDDWLVVGGRLQHLVALLLAWQHAVQLLIRERSVALPHLALRAHLVVGLWRHRHRALRACQLLCARCLHAAQHARRRRCACEEARRHAHGRRRATKSGCRARRHARGRCIPAAARLLCAFHGGRAWPGRGVVPSVSLWCGPCISARRGIPSAGTIGA